MDNDRQEHDLAEMESGRSDANRQWVQHGYVQDVHVESQAEGFLSENHWVLGSLSLGGQTAGTQGQTCFGGERDKGMGSVAQSCSFDLLEAPGKVSILLLERLRLS